MKVSTIAEGVGLDSVRRLGAGLPIETCVRGWLGVAVILNGQRPGAPEAPMTLRVPLLGETTSGRRYEQYAT